MTRISSNFTLALKIFLPTFWFVFFGVFGIAILTMGPNSNPLLANALFKLTYIVFFILFSLLIYYTFLQLKRVDYDSDGIYVSNYYTTYKYSFDSIDIIRENDFWFFKTANFVLKKPGKFGKIIRFIPSNPNYRELKEKFLSGI